MRNHGTAMISQTHGSSRCLPCLRPFLFPFALTFCWDPSSFDQPFNTWHRQCFAQFACVRLVLLCGEAFLEGFWVADAFSSLPHIHQHAWDVGGHRAGGVPRTRSGPSMLVV